MFRLFEVLVSFIDVLIAVAGQVLVDVSEPVVVIVVSRCGRRFLRCFFRFRLYDFRLGIRLGENDRFLCGRSSSLCFEPFLRLLIGTLAEDFFTNIKNNFSGVIPFFNRGRK